MLIILLVCERPLAAAELRIGNALALPGGTALVPVRWTGDTPIVAAQFDLLLESSHVAAGDATRGPAAMDHTVTSGTPAADSVRIVVYSPTNAVLGQGTWVYVPLTLSSNTPHGPIALTPAHVVLADAAAEAVTDFSVVAGAIGCGDTRVDPPVITAQPTDQVARIGQDVVLHVAVSGTPPLGYQWRRNGTHLTDQGRVNGATTASLSIANAQSSDAAAYDVVVANAADTETSVVASLRVAQPLTVSVVGSGTVTRLPEAGGDDIGQWVTLTATPARWHEFVRWSDGVTSNPRAITIGLTNTYTAVFTNSVPLETWMVHEVPIEVPVGTPKILVNGELAWGGRFAIPSTEPITLAMETSFPNGSIFYTLEGSPPDPGSLVFDKPFAVTESVVVRAVAYDAAFLQSAEADPVEVVVLPMYPLTVGTPGGGSVGMEPLGALFPSNTVVALTATASDGWTFMHWAGDAVATDPSINVVMDGPKNVSGVFGTSLTNVVSPSGYGAVLREPAEGPFPFGSMIRLSAVPVSGRYFLRWTGAANGSSNSPLAFVVTNANPTVGSLFGTLPANNHALTLLVAGQGTVTPAPQQAYYTNGQSVSVTAAAASSNVFLRWSGDAGGAVNPLDLTVTSNLTITANFGSELPSDTPPVILLSGPAPNSIFTAPAMVSLVADAHDADGWIVAVSFLANGSLIGVRTSAPYALEWSNVPAGAYTLTTRATDNGGLISTSAPVDITVQTALPEIAISSPTQGAVYWAPADVLLTALASDADQSIARVDFCVQSSTNVGQPVLLGSVVEPPYRLTWSNVTAGTYTLTAQAVDGYGPTVTSVPVSITVSLPATPAVFRLSADRYETSESAATVSLTVLNDGTLGGTVNYATADVTAVGGSGSSGDYLRAQGLLTFAEGEVSKALTITNRDDYLYETDETFEVRLTNPSPGSSLGVPAFATVTIRDNDADAATNSLLAIAFPGGPPETSGRLRIWLQPAEAGGQWRFPWELGWHASGQTVTNLAADNYEVEFRPITGYEADPPGLLVPVPAGTLTEITHQYVHVGGSDFGWLTVTIAPEAVGSNGGWRFVGEGSWRLGGAEAGDLTPGTYLVEFKPVSGWAAPATREVQVVAEQGAAIAGNYLIAGTLPAGVALPTPLANFNVINDSLLFTPQLPYAFNGQLHTAAGFGSGVAVRERVVLTAAHVVFNDTTLSYVDDVDWRFQRHAGEFDPKPQRPRGWYVLSGYATARTNDLAGGLSPGVSSPESRPWDVAALYFLEPAARGGYGGYLTSDATPNEWLVSSRQKLLVGYPVDGASFGYPGVVPGKMHKVDPMTYAFALQSNRVYGTTGFLGFPGNSGGPVCVLHTNNTYYPAAVYLGNVGSLSVVRAIDSNVVSLINQAANLGDAGTNQTGGGVITVISGTSGTGTRAYVQVRLGPPSAQAAGAAWRLQGETSWLTDPRATRSVGKGASAVIEFRELAGWVGPAERSLTLVLGQTTVIDATYTVAPPALQYDRIAGLLVQGTLGTSYVIEQSPSVIEAAWTTIGTVTLAGMSTPVPGTVPVSGHLRFYRARWVP